MPHRDKYTDLKIKTVEWDSSSPVFTVVWTVNVEHKYRKRKTNEIKSEHEQLELIFPLCLS